MQNVNYKIKQNGSSMVEVLVSISLLGLVLASSAKVIVLSMHANKASRTYASVMSDVQDIIDDYRGQSYFSLLSRFGASYSAITDGQTATETVVSARSRSDYTVTLTAKKTVSTASPESVEIRVQAAHRRGMLTDANYDFRTIVSQAR